MSSVIAVQQCDDLRSVDARAGNQCPPPGNGSSDMASRRHQAPCFGNRNGPSAPSSRPRLPHNVANDARPRPCHPPHAANSNNCPFGNSQPFQFQQNRFADQPAQWQRGVNNFGGGFRMASSSFSGSGNTGGTQWPPPPPFGSPPFPAITARSATLNHSSSNRTDLPTSQLSGSEGSITLAEVFAWPVPHFLAAATLVGHSGLLLLRLEAPPSQLVSRTTGSLAARGGGGGYGCYSPPAPPLPSAQQGFEGGQSYGGFEGQPRFVQYNQGQAWPAQPNMGQAPLQQNSWVQGRTCPESGNGWGNF